MRRERTGGNTEQGNGGETALRCQKLTARIMEFSIGAGGGGVAEFGRDCCLVTVMAFATGVAACVARSHPFWHGDCLWTG